jgi:TonB family protein
MRPFPSSLFAVALSFHAACHETELGPRQVARAFAPLYDTLLLQAQMQGVVRVRVRVSPSGEVEEVNVLESFWPGGNRQTEAIARQWRFVPAELPSEEEIVFKFRFVDSDSPPEQQGTVFLPPTTVEIRHAKPLPVSMH